MDAAIKIIGLALIAAVAYGAYRLYQWLRPKTLCPTCGGEMIPDHCKYRYTVEWECKECGETLETMRGER